MKLKRMKQIPRAPSRRTPVWPDAALPHQPAAEYKKRNSTMRLPVYKCPPDATTSTPVPVARMLTSVIADLHLLRKTQTDGAGVITTQA
ncbi:hypothetical protein D3C72_234890 [compost metagenome]